MADIKPLRDPTFVAETLGVPVTTLAYWRTTGEGPAFVKIGRLVRYTDEALWQFIDQNTRQQVSA